jgi:type IV secretion system protein VirD4
MFQYIAQTYEKYSHDEAKAFTNIKTKVAYTAEDINDAEFICKMLGTRTKRVISHSVSNQSNGSSNSRNVNKHAIPLLRADEIMKLSPQVSLIIRSGSAPIKARQWIWYEEASMRGLPFGTALLSTDAKQFVLVTRY